MFITYQSSNLETNHKALCTRVKPNTTHPKFNYNIDDLILYKKQQKITKSEFSIEQPIFYEHNNNKDKTIKTKDLITKSSPKYKFYLKKLNQKY